MKKQFYILLMCLSLCILTISGCSDNSINANTESKPLQLTLSEAFEQYLSSNNISGEILYFTSNSYTGGEEMQAFTLVGTNEAADLWYTDAKITEKLVSQITISEAPTVVTTSSKPIYIVDVISEGNVKQSYAYVVIDGKPLRLSGHGEDLTSMGGDDFFTVVSTTDQKTIER